MNIKHSRQAMSITSKELRRLADYLDVQTKETFRQFGNPNKIKIKEVRYSYPIINKMPECSDTWEFEKQLYTGVKDMNIKKETKIVLEQLHLYLKNKIWLLKNSGDSKYEIVTEELDSVLKRIEDIQAELNVEILLKCIKKRK